MCICSEESSGRFTNNIIVKNGWREEWVCPQVGICNYGTLYEFDISYNDVWGNEEGEYQFMPDYTERDGNISIDPGFVDEEGFRLAKDSPLRNAGNPLLTDPDGTPSDIGIYGGPRARRQAEIIPGSK